MSHSIYSGLKVLDLSRIISGPNCTMLLADMGADVIKVEKRGEGDTSRAYEPFVNGESMYHYVLNRNKRSMELDFRSKDGKRILFELAKKADVIVQNFKPGTLAKMGLSEEVLREVNPGVIIVNISGFGQTGPYANRPGFDAIAQAMSGLMSLTGDPDGPPTMMGAFVIDYMTGLYALIALQGALYERNKTGIGQSVEACLLDSAISILLTDIPYQTIFNRTITRVGNRDRITAPGNVFKTKNDEWVFCVAGTDDFFKRFAKTSGNDFLIESDEYSTIEKRLERVDEVEKYLGDWIAKYTTDEIVQICADAGITCAKVETLEDVVENPQLKYRGKIMEVEHPKVGKIPMQGFPIGFSKSPVELRYAPPTLGEHTDEILKEWLSLSSEEIAELRNNKII